MIVLVGKSGSGKTSIAKCLSNKINRTITYTSRPKREDEVSDVDYHFVSKEEFNLLAKANNFLEYRTYNDWYYGTSYAGMVDNSVIILSPEGFEAIKQIEKLNITSFYIKVNDAARLEKLNSTRQDKLEIERRDKEDKKDFVDIENKVDYVICNIDYNQSPILLANKIYKLYSDRHGIHNA